MERGMTGPRNRASAALLSASVAVFSVTALLPASAAGGLSAAASVSPRAVPAGEATYTFTLRNTSDPPGQRIGSVRVTPPRGWHILGCPDGPGGWSARMDGRDCFFESARGSRDDLVAGAVATLRVAASVAGPTGRVGEWRLSVQAQDRFTKGDRARGGGDRVEVAPAGAGLTTVVMGSGGGPTSTPTPVPSSTPSPSPSATSSPSPSATASPTSPSPSPSPSRPSPPSVSPSPSVSPTRSATPAPSVSPTPSTSRTPGPQPSASPSVAPTISPSPSSSPSPSPCPDCGTPGNDFIEIGPGDLADGFEAVKGGDGNDKIVVSFVDVGAPWEIVVRAGSGNDDIVISIDTLTTTRGAITLRTGTGRDSVVVDSWAPVEVTAGRGHDQITCGWGSDRVGAGPGEDSVACRSGSDLIVGGTGSDGLRGGRGPDRLRGGPGRDLCFATAGDVLLSCRRALR